MRSRFSTIVAATGALLLLGACGGGTTEAGSGGGTELTVYSGMDPVVQDDLAAAFKKLHPKVSLSFVRGSAQELGPRLEAEWRTGKGVGDILVGGSGDLAWLDKHAETGDFVPIKSSHLADKEWKEWAHKDGRWVTAQWVPFNGIAWNADRVKNPPTSFDDLTSGDYKGRLGVFDASLSPVYKSLYMLMSKDLGDDWVDGLLKQKVRVYPSGAPMFQGAIAGEIDVVLGANPAVSQLIKDGAPLKVIYPEPVVTTANNLVISKTAPEPKAAQTFADFMLSKEGQTILNVGGYSAYSGLKGALGTASDVVTVSSGGFTEADFKEFTARWNRLISDSK